MERFLFKITFRDRTFIIEKLHGGKFPKGEALNYSQTVILLDVH